jgi:hypothetical protein
MIDIRSWRWQVPEFNFNHTQGGEMNNDSQVIQMPKWARLDVFRGHVNDKFEIEKDNDVGIAFVRSGSNSFRVRLWMWMDCQFVLKPTRDDQYKFDILTAEESREQDGKKLTFWNKVGSGEWFGDFIHLKFNVLDADFFLDLRNLPKEGAMAKEGRFSGKAAA